MISFFGNRYYNVFDYKPRYYDPEKEKIEDGLKQLRNEKGKDEKGTASESYVPGSTIKGSFHSRMRRTSYSKTNSIIRIFIIAVFLFFVAYLILVADLSSVIEYLRK